METVPNQEWKQEWVFGYLEKWFSFGGMRGWGIHQAEDSEIERETFQNGSLVNLGHCSYGWYRGPHVMVLWVNSMQFFFSFVQVVFNSTEGKLGLSFGQYVKSFFKKSFFFCSKKHRCVKSACAGFCLFYTTGVQRDGCQNTATCWGVGPSRKHQNLW